MAVTNTTIDLINDTFPIDENSTSNVFNLFANDSGAAATVTLTVAVSTPEPTIDTV